MKFAAGKFKVELNEIEQFLRKLDFFEERNYYPNEDFDPSVYRNKTYFENWKTLIAQNIYNFLLSDNSILHFKVKEAELKINFAFYECPYICQTYKEFLDENNLGGELEDRLFLDYYEVYMQQCPVKENPTMIRYDLDLNSYYEGFHPVSHIHIGTKNQIRIGVNKVMGPKSFLNFVLRQTYPAYWKGVISKEDEWKGAYLKEKSGLLDVESRYWKPLDYSEFFLG